MEKKLYSAWAYRRCIADLRALLAKLGRKAFREYGYSAQLRQYRRELREVVGV